LIFKFLGFLVAASCAASLDYFEMLLRFDFQIFQTYLLICIPFQVRIYSYSFIPCLILLQVKLWFYSFDILILFFLPKHFSLSHISIPLQHHVINTHQCYFFISWKWSLLFLLFFFTPFTVLHVTEAESNHRQWGLRRDYFSSANSREAKCILDIG
jgi:hypothetical protein